MQFFSHSRGRGRKENSFIFIFWSWKLVPPACDHAVTNADSDNISRTFASHMCPGRSARPAGRARQGGPGVDVARQPEPLQVRVSRALAQ